MAKVVSIRGGVPVEPKDDEKPEPCQPLIEALEDALKRAKAGELQSFIGAGFTAEGQGYYLIAGFHESDMEMLGMLEWLRQDFFMRNLTEDTDVE